MFIVLTLGMVVLAHLLSIGVVMMALATVWGVVLYLTRPAASPATSSETRYQQPDLALETVAEPTSARRFAIPAQSGERDPRRPAGATGGPRR